MNSSDESEIKPAVGTVALAKPARDTAEEILLRKKMDTGGIA